MYSPSPTPSAPSHQCLVPHIYTVQATSVTTHPAPNAVRTLAPGPPHNLSTHSIAVTTIRLLSLLLQDYELP